MDRNIYLRELGLDERAKREDLILAYRRLMIQWHPERSKPSDRSDARGKVSAITSAFLFLEKGYQSPPNRASLEPTLRMAEISATYGAPRFQTVSFEPTSLTFFPARSVTELGFLPKLKISGTSTGRPPREAKRPVQSTVLICGIVVVFLLIVFSSVKEDSHQDSPPIASPVPQASPVATMEVNRAETNSADSKSKTNGSIIARTNRLGATIQLRRRDGLEPVYPSRADGDRIVFQSIPFGEYRVTAHLKGWPDVTKTLTLDQGRDTELFLEFIGASLRIESDPSDAAVMIGGKTRGRSPVTIKDTAPGLYSITLQYKNWPEFSTTIALEANQETKAMIRIPYGQLDIETTPSGAMISIDGVDVGRAPMVLSQVPAGQRRLRLTAENYEPYETLLGMTDLSTLQIRPVLVSNIAQLNPNGLLNLVWTNGQQVNRKYEIAPAFDSTANFRPKNGLIKNLDRQKLHEKWADRLFRYEGTVRRFDRTTGILEFADESGEKSKYRVAALLSQGARANEAFINKLFKGARIETIGRLTAAEEPRWPAKTILFELSEAEPSN